MSDAQRQMEADHRRDYGEHRQMQDLSRAIAAFLNDPPRRVGANTVRSLTDVKTVLDAACAHIVRVWD